jgi:protein TonB
MKTHPPSPASLSRPEHMRGFMRPGEPWFALFLFAAALAIGLLIGLAWVATHRTQPATATATTAAAPIADSQHPPLPAPTSGDLSAMPTPKPGAPHIVETTPAEQPAANATATLPASSASVAAPATIADTPPQIVERVQPTYPAEALRNQEQGTVRLRIALDAGGAVTDVQIAQSSGARALDRAAMDAARNWKFKPATQNGQPAAGAIEVPVEFRLEER